MDGRFTTRVSSIVAGACAAALCVVAFVHAQEGPPALPPLPQQAESQQPEILPPATIPPVAAGQLRPPAGPLVTNPFSDPLQLIEFRDLTLDEASRALSDQSGLKIVPSAEASKVHVSLYLRDVPASVALDALTKANGLFYRQDRDSGIIRIYTTKEYENDLGSFREERTEVFTLLYPNPVDVAVAIRGLFGDRVQMSLGVDETMSYQDLLQRFLRFDIVSQRNQGLGAAGQGGFGRNGFGGGGGGGGFGGGGFGGGFGGGGFGSGLGGFGGGLGGFGGGGLFGSNQYGGNGYGNNNQNQQQQPETQPLENLTPDQIQQLEAARSSASPEGQAAIDELLRQHQARIYVTVIRRNNQVVVRTSDEAIMQRIQELISSLDVPTPLVLLEVKVMELRLDDLFTSVFDYQYTDGKHFAAGFTAGDIGPIPPAGADADSIGISPHASGLGSSSVPFGTDRDLTFQYVSKNFRARIQLLENNNRVTNLATPLLLTANNEVSRIFIGETVPITVGFTPGQVATNVVNNTIVTSVPEVELRDVGQSLLITPNINADRTVTLRIAQEKSSINHDGGQVPVPNSSGNGFTNVPVDTVRSSTVSGTIVAKDGCAVAIGGLIDEGLSDLRYEVPVIGKIPVIGFFFRKQRTDRSRTELVVMVRPYVFNTPAESAALSRELIPELSVHPLVTQGGSTLNSFNPPEVLRANPPKTKYEQVFRFHSLEPKTF